VTAAPNREIDAAVAGSSDHGHHVRRIDALDDGVRPAVVHGVVHCAGVVVVGIGRDDDATSHRLSQLFDRVLHGVLLCCIN
jgi:hypothetical protein